MTLKEFKADYQRETGAKMSAKGWSALYSQYQEQEAEAIAGGREIDPEIAKRLELAKIAAKDFRVSVSHIVYDDRDAAHGSASRLIAGFDTRGAAEEFVAAQCGSDDVPSDDVWYSIYPPRVVAIVVQTDDCPF